MYNNYYKVTNLTHFNILDCLVCIHATPVLEDVADCASRVDESHVTLSSPSGAPEAAILQLKVPHPGQDGLTVDSREVVPQDEQTGEGSVHHGHMTAVKGVWF